MKKKPNIFNYFGEKMVCDFNSKSYQRRKRCKLIAFRIPRPPIALAVSDPYGKVIRILMLPLTTRCIPMEIIMMEYAVLQSLFLRRVGNI